MVYGSISSTVTIYSNNFVTKHINYYLYTYTSLYIIGEVKSLEDVDLSETFNHCTILLYCDHPNLKYHSSIRMHTDIVHNHDGIYMPAQSSQAETTPTTIITTGDSRSLKWQKRTLTKHSETGRDNWMIDKIWK